MRSCWLNIMRTAVIPACLGLALALGGPAAAAPLDNAAIDAAPQHYVITLSQRPVSEVAEEVLGQTLGLPVSVDPRVGGRMTFRVEGVYSPQALARELGLQLWDVNVALVEDQANGLMLIPVEALPEALAMGAEAVSPRTPAAAPQEPSGSVEVERPNPVAPERDLPARPLNLMVPLLTMALIVGWIGGIFTPSLLRALRSGAAGRGSRSGLARPDLDDPHEFRSGTAETGLELDEPDLAEGERDGPDRAMTKVTTADKGGTGGSAVIAIDFRARSN